MRLSTRLTLRSLFLMATSAAVIAALVDIVGVVYRYDGGRPRDIGWAWLAHLLTLWIEPRAFTWLPLAVSRYYEFGQVGESLRFLATAIVASVVFAWLFYLLLTPLVYLVAARRRPGAVFEWSPAALLGLWLVLLSPSVLHFSCEMSMVGLSHTGYGSRLLIGTGLVVLLWLLLVWPVSRMPRFGKLSRRGGQAGVAVLCLFALAGTVAELAPSGAEIVPPADSSHPNILLISIDSLRADHVHSYGYTRETSPVIDALAAQGALFRYTVAPTSWTLPSHVTMLTSLPPEQHKVTSDLTRLQPEAVTLAETLHAAGYRTAAFVSGAFLRAEYGHRQGFDHFDDYSAMPLAWNAHRQITSPDLVPLVSNWLDQWDRGGRKRPFFIFLHMWDVHYDYLPPAPYNTMFDPDYTGWVTTEGLEGDARINPNMKPRDLQHVIALYDGEIRFTDHYVGKLFEFLSRRGLFDSSVVALTADHGEEFFEHGHKGHRRTLYDDVLLVPLIVRYPPLVPAGKRVSRQVRLLDVAPTLLHLAGVTPPPGFGMKGGGPDAGHDLSPLWEGDSRPDTPSPPSYGMLSYQLASVRTDDWKLIFHPTGNPRPELYDLRTDPGEQVNVAPRNTALLDQLYRQVTAFRGASAKDREYAANIEMGREHMEALRSLGYLTDYVEKAVRGSARIVSPAPGSRIDSPTVTFRWDGDASIKQYYLMVGHSAYSEDIYGKDQGRHKSVTVSGIPLDGGKLSVGLFWRLGREWLKNDFEYSTAHAAAAGTPVSASAAVRQPARILSPKPGSRLGGPNVRFQWTSPNDAAQFYLKVGSRRNSGEIYAGDQGMHTSVDVTGIPRDGCPIFVRLLWKVGQDWNHADFLYQTTPGTSSQ